MVKAEIASNVNREIDKPRDHCAVVGIISFSGKDVAPYTRIALHDLQNRGEDGSGIATRSDYSGFFTLYKDLGLVAHAFPDGKLEEEQLSGSLAIGHNRYATSGIKDKERNDRKMCLQPYHVGYDKRSLVLAHNGNIPQRYLQRLRDELPTGVPLESDSDSEVIAWRILFAKGNTWREKIINGLDRVIGAYSLVIGTDDGDLFGIKDPRGIRPLVMATTKDGAALVSESRGLEHIDGVLEKREVKSGQMVHIAKNGDVSIEQIFPKVTTARCLIEPIYLKHPYSYEGEHEVRTIRERMGEGLARELVAQPDWMIIGVPDSGIEIAEGYAQALGRKNYHFIKKDRYRPNRTFIGESDGDRTNKLELKFTISDSVKRRKLVIVDDSVIRGKTTKKLIASLRAVGASEVHVLSGSPPFIDICDLGVDIATLQELLALKKNGGKNYMVKTLDEIAAEIGADSIYYLSLGGLIEAIGGEKNDFCTNCLNREHPIEQAAMDAEVVYSTRSYALSTGISPT